jgi:hypothetical protein
MFGNLRDQWANTPLWQRALLLIIFPAVVVGALWFYMVKPTLEERDRLRQERQRLLQEINRYRALIKPEVLQRLRDQIAKLEEEVKKKREELEKVVGKIPTQKDLERILGEMNYIAGLRELVITRISLSRPKVQRFQLVEKDGRKVVQVVAQPQRAQVRRTVRRPPRRGEQRRPERPPEQQGIPIVTVEIAMTVEGKTRNIQAFLTDLHRRGLVSYPKAVRIKPLREEGKVSADVVIDVILQR